MRVDVKKFLFVGPKESQNTFFSKAQEAGIIHFIKDGSKSFPKEIETLIQALKIVAALPAIEQIPADSDALLLANEIISANNRIDHIAKEKRVLKDEKERIAPFGQFSFDDLYFIKEKSKRHPRFFIAQKGTSVPDLILVNSDQRHDYFFGFLNDDLPLEGMTEIRIEKSLGDIEKRAQEIEEEYLLLKRRLHEFSKQRAHLQRGLARYLDSHHLQKVKHRASTEVDGRIFAVAGWVADMPKLKSLVDQLDIYSEEIAPDENETPPTFLDNKGVSKIGEDLVHIYDTPSAEDRDPSLFVLISFALFFSMIIGDAGYGLILLAASLWFKVKYQGKRLINLMLILGTSCILWGLLTTSFFGIEISQESFIRKVSLIDALAEKKMYASPFLVDLEKTGQGIMVELVLTVGVIHILISLVRYMDRNYAAIGWCLFVIGAYLYIPEYLQEKTLMHYIFHFSHDTLKTYGIGLIALGMSVAVAFSIYANRLLGLLEAMTAVQIFSDVLSYLRLYALGLSGAIVSQTVNGFAESSPYLLLSILILVLGHSINIVLAVMGGVIHGLRLNFLEWYHYSFYGGGTPFNPLKKSEEQL